MPVYIMPLAKTSNSEFKTVIDRVGAELIEIEKLYEFVKLADFSKIQFFPMSESLVSKLMRNLSELVPDTELPRPLFGVPGYAHSGRWATEVASLPPEEWTSILPTLAKSGLIASNASDAEARNAERRAGKSAPEETVSLSEQFEAKRAAARASTKEVAKPEDMDASFLENFTE